MHVRLELHLRLTIMCGVCRVSCQLCNFSLVFFFVDFAVCHQIEISFHYVSHYLWFVSTYAFVSEKLYRCLRRRSIFVLEKGLRWFKESVACRIEIFTNCPPTISTTTAATAARSSRVATQKSTKKGQALRFGKWLIIASEMRP